MAEGPLRRIRLPIDQLRDRGSTGMSAMERLSGQVPEASYTNRRMANTTWMLRNQFQAMPITHARMIFLGIGYIGVHLLSVILSRLHQL